MEAQTLLLLVMFGSGLTVSALIIRFLLRFKCLGKLRPADLHHQPGNHTPRLGGLALVIAFLVLLFLAGFAFGVTLTRPLLCIVCASLALFVLGMVDDFRPTEATTKFLVQVCIAFCVWSLGTGIFELPLFSPPQTQLPTWISLFLTVVWIVVITNAINLIDGLDALAGGICLAVLLIIGCSGGTEAAFAFGIIGSLLAFLKFNYAPAQIYLGDGGAYFLGGIIALLTLVESQNGRSPGALIMTLSTLAVPILDMQLAVLRRWLEGRPILQADRGHIHHRLLDRGLCPKKVLLILYSLTAVAFALGAALWSDSAKARWFSGPVAVGMVFWQGRIIFGPVRLRVRIPRIWTGNSTRHWLIQRPRHPRSTSGGCPNPLPTAPSAPIVNAGEISVL